jgi:hypothetical protein
VTTKAEVDLASYRKAPRLLGPQMEEALAPGGSLAVVLDAVRANRDLRLDIRERRFNIYYRGGSLLCVDGRRSPWTMRFDKKYLAGQMGTLPKLPVIYSSADDAHAWVDAFPQLMQVMDRWWLANPRAERDYCQNIARDNPPDIENPTTDFHVFDIEYQWAQRRFDLVAAHRRATDADPSGWQEPDLVLVEVKSDLDACRGGSGLVAHTHDYVDIMKAGTSARGGSATDSIKNEHAALVGQKRRLGLVDDSVPFRRFSDSPLGLLLVLVGLDLDTPELSRTLWEVLRAVEDLGPQGCVLLMRLATPDYRMSDEKLIPLGAFAQR